VLALAEVTVKHLSIQQLAHHNSERGVILAISLLTGFSPDIILAVLLTHAGEGCFGAREPEYLPA